MRITLLTFGNDRRTRTAGDMAKGVADRVLEGRDPMIEVELIDITETDPAEEHAFLTDVLPLFRRFGSDLLLAVFIDGEMVAKGGVPSPELLTRLIDERSG